MTINKPLKLSLEAAQTNIWEWHISTNKVWEYGYFDPLTYVDAQDTNGFFENFEKKFTQQIAEKYFKPLKNC